MSKLVWDQVGERFYETGTKKGVLYVQSNGTYPLGVAWNGLTAVNESPEGAEANDIYADDIKYLTLRSAENFKATIEAYTYPEEFEECDGSRIVAEGVTIGAQPRKSFGFSFVTTYGNDTELDEYGYKIHLIYGATVSPSEKSYQTINDNPEAISFSWEVDTIPIPVTGYKPTAHIVINSTKFTSPQAKAKLLDFEDILYGTDGHEAITAQYVKTSDASKVAGKTYYTLSGSTYSEFTGSTFAANTDYYELTVAARDSATAANARLPLPDEVISLLTVA